VSTEETLQIGEEEFVSCWGKGSFLRIYNSLVAREDSVYRRGPSDRGRRVCLLLGCREVGFFKEHLLKRAVIKDMAHVRSSTSLTNHFNVD